MVDTQPLTFSAQYIGVTRSGERTIDTFLDQIVFGIPLIGFGLWQKSHLHEASRRRNNECGINVIVASASTRRWRSGNRETHNILTADAVAQ